MYIVLGFVYANACDVILQVSNMHWLLCPLKHTTKSINTDPDYDSESEPSDKQVQNTDSFQFDTQFPHI